MSDSPLKSYQFRRQREPIWRELNILVDKVEGRGLSSLTTYEIIRLPALYRSVVSSLSVARKISLDRSLLNYLEALAMRAYFCVYATRTQFRRSVAIFFRTSFPQSVRRAGWHILAASLIVLLGGLTSYVLTLANTDWYYTFIPAGLIGNRLPTTSTAELQATLYQSADVASAVAGFSSWLFSHNAGIGMLAFALGFALGIPSILLLFYNGLTIGAFGEQAIAANLISIHFVNAVDHPPIVAPFRGRFARFTTNPICIAIPGNETVPRFLLHMATTRIALGKARVAMNENRPLDVGTVIDADGQPSRDATVMFEACLSGLHPHPLGLEWAQTGYRGARHGCSRARRSPIPAFATRVPATFPR